MAIRQSVRADLAATMRGDRSDTVNIARQGLHYAAVRVKERRARKSDAGCELTERSLVYA